jgi:hypothetical protein
MKLLNKTLKFNILILTILIWLPKASVLAQQSLSDTIEIE